MCEDFRDLSAFKRVATRAVFSVAFSLCLLLRLYLYSSLFLSLFPHSLSLPLSITLPLSLSLFPSPSLRMETFKQQLVKCLTIYL